MDFNNLWSGIDHLNCKQNTRCLAINTILAGKYLVGPVLGQGGFGITYLGYDLNMETHIAIKEYFPVELVSRDTTTMHGDKVLSLSDEKSVTYQQGLKKYVAEAQNVSQFSEMPGVVSVKDFFYENETAYIVMEYIDGISLKDYLKEKGGRLSEEETLTIMKPVLEALVKVHDAGIIHRDISPDNIMLTFEKETTDGRILKSVKLIDFGAARMTTKNDQKSLTIILKHGYAPEEQYRTHGEQGPWTDVYAVCAVMYRMLTGETPVQAMDRMFKDELKGFDECNVNINANTSAAILKGLAVKKDNRIQDIGELIGILYEGNKVKTAIKTNKKHLFIFAGIGVALIISFLVVIVGSNNRTNGKENNIKASDEVASTENFANQSVGNDSVNGAESDEDYVTLDTDVQEENVVKLVRTTPQGMLAGGDDFILSLRADGTVRAAGNNENNQCEVSAWYDVVAVYSSRSTSAGLRKDGTVVIAGDDLNREVSSWSGIVDIALDSRYILGLTKDGKVISAGRNDNGCCDTGDWENIVSISSAGGISFGVTHDGELLIAGTEDYYTEELAVMSQWKDIKQIGIIPGDGHFYGLKTDGTVLYTGERHKESLDSWSKISTIVTGENWLAGLKEDGSVVTTSYTYLGLGDIVSEWSDIVEIAGTFYNMVGLKKDGTLVVARKVKSVSGEGWCSIDDILSMNDIKQAVWVDNYLVVLRKNGRINATVKQVNRWLSPSDISEWKDISIIVSDGYDGLIGITKDGTILREEKEYVSVSGKEISSKEAYERKEKTPRIYNSWKNVKQISARSSHIVAILEDGTVKAAGFPESQPDTDYRTGLRTDGSCDVNDWSDIRQVLVRLGYTIGLKNDGTLIWTQEGNGDFGHFKGLKSIWGNSRVYYNNIAGILEDGTVIEIQLRQDVGMNNFAGWTDMIQLGVSNAHVAGLRADGTVLATGSNFAGQCDVEEWTDVVYIDVCDSATIGVTSDGRLLMAGAFPNDLCVVEEWEALPVDAMLEAGTKK